MLMYPFACKQGIRLLPLTAISLSHKMLFYFWLCSDLAFQRTGSHTSVLSCFPALHGKAPHIACGQNIFDVPRINMQKVRGTTYMWSYADEESSQEPAGADIQLLECERVLYVMHMLLAVPNSARLPTGCIFLGLGYLTCMKTSKISVSVTRYWFRHGYRSDRLHITCMTLTPILNVIPVAAEWAPQPPCKESPAPCQWCSSAWQCLCLPTSSAASPVQWFTIWLFGLCSSNNKIQAPDTNLLRWVWHTCLLCIEWHLSVVSHSKGCCQALEGL